MNDFTFNYYNAVSLHKLCGPSGKCVHNDVK